MGDLLATKRPGLPAVDHRREVALTSFPNLQNARRRGTGTVPHYCQRAQLSVRLRTSDLTSAPWRSAHSSCSACAVSDGAEARLALRCDKAEQHAGCDRDADRGPRIGAHVLVGCDDRLPGLL